MDSMITLLCEMATGVFWSDNSPRMIQNVLNDLNGVPILVDDEEETTPIEHETDEQLYDAWQMRRAELVQDDPADMDEAAVRILMANIQAGRDRDLEVA